MMELVHMHEGLVRFPAVARLVESGPSNQLSDELLLVVLSDSQRIGADSSAEGANVMDVCSIPLA